MDELPRDSQKARVVKAEKMVEPQERKFGNMLSFAVHVGKQKWWTDRGMPSHIKAKHCTTGCMGHLIEGKVLVPARDGLGYLGILHGMSHVLSPPTSYSPAHGPNFCSAYLSMVEEFQPDLYIPLNAAFSQLRIKSNPITEEQFKAAKLKRDERKAESMARKEQKLEQSLRDLIAKLRP